MRYNLQTQEFLLNKVKPITLFSKVTLNTHHYLIKEFLNKRKAR
jgi:hypothetical protein